MEKIICLHKRDKVPDGYYTVDCMRPNVLGNPFPLKDESKRDECIEQFRQYLWKEMKGNGEVRILMRKLAYSTESFALLCCCKPKSCHTDVIKNALIWMKQTNYK